MKVPRAFLSTPDIPGFFNYEKGVTGSFDAENGLLSFNQPVGYRNEGVAGVIEHLDIVQCF